jgi:predicted SAM-dependent methyltransferase
MAPDERDAIAAHVNRFGGVKEGQRILEVGSHDVNGIVRDLFEPPGKYIGIDHREGDNVDIALNGNDMSAHFEDESFDWVLCNSVMEHDLHFWLTTAEMKRVLKPGGILIVGMPGLGFTHHGVSDDIGVNPGIATNPEGAGIYDYYRFTAAAYYRFFLKGYQEVEVHNVERCGYLRLCAAGIKP